MKSYPERRRRQEALAIAQRLVTSLATGLYCGASGMPCDRAGADCCMKSLPEEYQEFAQSPTASSEGDRE